MPNITVANKEYNVIQFSARTTNKSVTMSGVELAKGYLSATDTKIYNTRSGKPVVKTDFKNLDLTVRFGEWLASTYSEWFELWDSYPDADLISWCKYSVPGGARLFEMVELLNKLTITITDKEIAWAYNSAKKEELKWMK
jgi:hypothetical protein